MRATLSRPIERLEADPRREGAVRLVVGGRALLTVPVEALRAEGIGPGSVLSEEQLARLSDWADREAAYRTALRLLERRPFARRDLGRRLVLKGHPAEVVTPALDRAEAAGLLDDERFARHYVQTRVARGRGPARLRRELGVQGVPGPIVDRVLAEELSDERSREVLLGLVRKRSAQLGDLEKPDRVRRVLAFLARRGYSGAEVRKVVQDLC